MATSSAALPPVAKMYMICIWTETVLYGVNLVMYGLCMFILFRGANNAALSRVLVVLSTILFFLCTIHIAASLRQMLEAFVYAPANAQNSTLYWYQNTNPTIALKKYLYDTLVTVQYSVLIWRLYVVFMCDWKVVVFPITLVVGLAGTLLSISTLSVAQNASPHSALISSLIRAAWVFDLVLNVSVTGAIVARLWWMDRQVAPSVTTTANRYTFAMYVVVESGAIFLAINISILGLYTSNNYVSFTIIDVACQLAALIPFLIVVQVGLIAPRVPSGRHGDFSNTAFTVKDEMIFRPGAPEGQDRGQDPPLPLMAEFAYSTSASSSSPVS